MMRWGYNTNGCGDHPWEVALRILADLGYQSVAITLDYHVLNPFSPDLSADLDRCKRLLDRLRLRTVIETGARYLLDPDHKHEPTLVSPDPARRQIRIEFLKRAIAVAATLECDAVAFWSGTAHHQNTESDAATDERFEQSLGEVLREAERSHVVLALEPEPAMSVETTADALRWIHHFRSPSLGLTLDIGHLHCLNEGPIPAILEQCAPHLRNIHIEDMRRGRHEHLMFGDGEIEFPPILAAIREIGYTGGIHVELSRHNHAFPHVARTALEFLQCQSSR